MIDTSSSHPPRRTNWVRLVGTLLAIVLLLYLLSQQGWNEIIQALLRIGWQPVLIAMGLTLFSRLAVALRWHMLLRGGEQPIRWQQTTRLTFAGLFASNFLPTTIGGDVARLAGAVQLKFDAAYAAASLIVDRLVGMTGMAMALPLAFPYLAGSDLFSNQAGQIPTQWLGITLPGFIHPRKLVHKIQAAARRISGRILAALKLWLQHPGSLLLALVFSWLHMICLFVSIEILADGLEEPLPFALIAGMWSFVYYVTLLPVSINGYGLQEVSLVFFFTHLGGMSEPSSLMVALLVRTMQMLASVPGALFLPGIMAARYSPPSVK